MILKRFSTRRAGCLTIWNAFNDGVKTDFHDIAEFFFDDVELYMDMSEFLSYLRLPMAVRLI